MNLKQNSTSTDFIHDDISRCNNYKCPTNFCCARFRQIQVDIKKADRAMVSTTKFNGHEKDGLCDYFLNVEYSPHNP